MTMVLGPPWLRTSALGDSTRKYSARSPKHSPLSNAMVRMSRAGLRRISLGQGLDEGSAQGIAFFFGQFPRLSRQHHRHAVADGIGEARGAADQFLPLAVIAQHALGQGTDQDLEQLGIGFHNGLMVPSGWSSFDRFSSAWSDRPRCPFPEAPAGWWRVRRSLRPPAAPVSPSAQRDTSWPTH